MRICFFRSVSIISEVDIFNKNSWFFLNYFFRTECCIWCSMSRRMPRKVFVFRKTDSRLPAGMTCGQGFCEFARPKNVPRILVSQYFLTKRSHLCSSSVAGVPGAMFRIWRTARSLRRLHSRAAKRRCGAPCRETSCRGPISGHCGAFWWTSIVAHSPWTCLQYVHKIAKCNCRTILAMGAIVVAN